jgi:hypothetical protein
MPQNTFSSSFISLYWNGRINPLNR